MTNVGLVKQFLDTLVNHKDLTAIDHFVAENMLEHECFPAGIPANLEGLKKLFHLLHHACPDLFVVIEDTVIEADKVVIRHSWTGTHQGELFGHTSTRKRIQFSSIDIVRIQNGKIAEHWGETRWLELLYKVGIHSSQGENYDKY